MKRVCIVGYGAIGPIHAAAVEKCMRAAFAAYQSASAQGKEIQI